MKWRNKFQRFDEEKNSSSSSSSSSSSFSIFHVTPFSWISKLKLRNTKLKHELNSVNHSPPPPPPPPSPPRRFPDSIHRSFLSDSIDIHGVHDRSPPSVHGGCEVAHRLSLGDDEDHQRRTNTRKDCGLVQHCSIVDDLEMLTLGQHIPFSTLSRRWPPLEPDSDIDYSAECDGLRLGRRRRQLRARRRSKLATSSTEVMEPRRSFKCRTKVRIYSPRSAAAKVEANKIRTTAKEGKDRSELEKFAVVKCSSDPQKDFRESMVEMIRQKRIGRSEDLESLLACYLMLNSDEHHDVIVKVFRQVWFELKSHRFVSEKV